MIKSLTVGVTLLSLVALLAAPLVVSAQVVQPSREPATGQPGFFKTCDAASAKAACVVSRILEILLAIVFLIAVIFLVIGGFRYIISQGNEEGVEKAKGTITNAIIGMVVVLLAWIILRIVYNLLEGGAASA